MAGVTVIGLSSILYGYHGMTMNHRDLLEYSFSKIIPAENIVAKFQGRSKAVLSIASSFNEARIFLEVAYIPFKNFGECEVWSLYMKFLCIFQALERGLGGVVLKVEDVQHILKLKVISIAIINLLRY